MLPRSWIAYLSVSTLLLGLPLGAKQERVDLVPKSPDAAIASVRLATEMETAATTPAGAASAIRDLAGFKTNVITANDDGSSPLVPIGFSVNFYGKPHDKLWVNNNGNLTFDSAQSAYIPYGLVSTTREIIAPFFADVDTRGSGSALVTYGVDVVNGRPAFSAIYGGVGYYSYHVDKKNSFQVILIDRSDTGAGNFDIEFNYNAIQWDYTDTSTSAAVGYSNGSGAAGTFLQFTGSLQTGAFVDIGPYALTAGSRNSSVLGRYSFSVRNGAVCTFSLSEGARAFAAAGGTGHTTLTATPSTCSWIAVSSTPAWLHVTAPTATTTGTSDVRYTVDSNPATTERSGRIAIADLAYDVRQAATPIPVGSITVAINRSAPFELSGPSYYGGTGSAFTVPAAPVGAYTIVYGSVDGASSPPPETKTLSAGGSITFTGAYGTTCTAPVIRTNPADAAVPLGAAAQFQVLATGFAPLHYQWYAGNAGVVTAPVGADSRTLVTPPINAPTKYWVRVTNTCNHADSTAATATPASVSVYADQAWAWRPPTDPIRVYKAAGDLIDIVVSFKNTAAAYNSDVQVAIDAAQVRPDFVRAYRRGTIMELANKSSFPEDLTSSVTDNGLAAGSRIVKLTAQSIRTATTAAPLNEFIFRFQLKTPLAVGSIINPTITAGGQTIPLLNRNKVEVRNLADIILTNRKLLYRTYATNSSDSRDDTLSAQVGQLWESLVSLAEARAAILYCVDDYESPEQRDRSNLSTVKWEDTRKALPYDADPNTGSVAEDTAVNAVARTVDGLLQGWVNKLGGSTLASGRYAAIIGGDRVIPYYRTFEPMKDLAPYASGYYNASPVTITDAANNYFFTDMLYRNTDGSALNLGQVQNLYVGRIDGYDADTLRTQVQNSGQLTSAGSSVVKLENYRRNGSLDGYQSAATATGYVVTASTPNPGSVTLDLQPTATQFANKTADDPARWPDIQRTLKTGNFDIFRSISHGSLPGIYNSEDKYSKYMEGNDLLADRTALRNGFATTHPIIILDSCLNGLFDFSGTVKPNANHLVQQLLNLGPRAVIASSGITYSNMISDYNNAVSTGLFYLNTTGQAMNTATRSYGLTAQSKTGSTRQVMAKTLLQTNLFGLPWARIIAPTFRATASIVKETTERSAISDTREPFTTTTIGYSAGSATLKTVTVSVTGQAKRDVDATHSVIDIPGFYQTIVDATTPVLPQRNIQINMPLDAVVTNVNVNFTTPTSVGMVNIPGFKPYYPIFPAPAGFTDAYVDLPAGNPAINGTFEYTVFTTAQYKVVSIRITPIQYDFTTKALSVYATAAATVNYTTAATAILASFATDSDRYFPGASIFSTTGVENTSPTTQTYTLQLQVLDGASNVLSTNTVNPTVAPGVSATTPVTLTAPAAPGSYFVSLTATDSGGATIGVDQRVIIVDASPAADLAIAISASNLSPSPGASVAYTVDVVNNGSYDATGVLVSDNLPAGLTFVSATTTQGACSGTQNVACSLGTVVNGAAAQVIINAIAAAGNANNSATVTAVERDPNPTNNSATVGVAAAPVNVAVNRSTLTFGKTSTGAATTGPQDVMVTFTGGVTTWSALSNQSWLLVTPASGSGNGKFTVKLATTGLPTGATSGATVTVTAAGAANSPLNIAITLNTSSATVVIPPFGAFDTPGDNATGIAGNIAVTGWALDNIGVKSVTLWRDPVGPEPVHSNGYVYIADAFFVPDARPDVEVAYPGNPAAYRAGWGYLMLTNGLPSLTANKGNGVYKIHAIATDEEGNQVKLGTKTITVDNLHAVKPFGTLDTPAPGEIVSGTRINWGWAMTPQPGFIAVDGLKVWVGVDGVNFAHPVYGINRADIAASFPGYANSNTGVGYYLLDTTRFTNGLHNLGWLVYDNLGRGDGIGSRFIQVQNPPLAAGDPEQPALAAARAADRAYLLRAARLRRPADPAPSYPAFRSGYDLDAALAPVRQGGEGLLESIQLKELDRLELHLPPGQQWTGGLRIGDSLRHLPVGSTLDGEGGIFYWQLGPVFLGEYLLEFRADDDTVVVVPVRVGAKPAPIAGR